MIISVINCSKTLTDEQVLGAIRAINRQIAEDFEPYWSFGATLRLEGAVGDVPDKQKLQEMRGDAILYLWDKADVADALGYHESNNRGIPYGFIFTTLCKQLKESWTVTLSHEALELIGDAQGNLLVQGPHPENPEQEVFHWFEMCDAVQAQSYFIDDVEVANFVLPLYFTVGEQEGGRNDFLGRTVKGKGLRSFGVSPGGYIGYYDPRTRSHESYAAPDDQQAQQRIKIKGASKVGRGYVRKRSQATVVKEDEHLRVLGANALAPSADPIRHVVVLMLENRSFDHLLGDATRIYPDLDGIPRHGPRYSNVSTKSGTRYEQTPLAATKISVDVGHEHADTLKQLGGGGTPPMGGFIDAYLAVPGVNEANADQLAQVMAYFPMGDTPAGDSLPALHALARNFLVCDHWFSSMPGPTWQNRFFAHSGTCLGHVMMPSRQHPEYLRIYDQDTLYNRLGDAGKNWRIYHDGFPQSIVLKKLLPKLLTSHYTSMADFYKDARGPADKFPDYTFIEPRYFSPNENDQHPPSDIAPGDQLIANVYNALRGNEALWKSTLLVVTYDEHGGFFDHVPPPATIAPDGNTAEYSFARLGVRVPTILVSPWLARGVCKTQFDHTSLLRYACDKWGLPPLGRRTAPEAGVFQANSFASELTKLGAPRTDTPVTITGRAMPRARAVAVEPPIEGSREALLCYLASLAADSLETPKHAARKTGAQAAAAPDKTLHKLSDSQLHALAEQRFEQMLGAKPSVDPTTPTAEQTATRPARKRKRVAAKKKP